MSEPSIVGTFLSFIAEAPRFPKAKCKEIAEPNLFFPVSNEEYQANYPTVRKICFSCPHQTECALYAINYEVEYGIWGALSRDHRKRIWKLRKFGWAARKGRNCRDMRMQGMSLKDIAKRWRTSEKQVLEWIALWEKTEVKDYEDYMLI